MKRQFRDPYADWWDPIERRNYGETVHEDNDIMGVFSTEAYTHFTPAWGAVLVVCARWIQKSEDLGVYRMLTSSRQGCFLASVGVLLGIVYETYPDRVSQTLFVATLTGTI